jgi:hypothetical protein
MLVSSLDSFDKRNGPHTFALIVFAIFYFILVVLFGVRLRAWDAYSPGQCYESGIITVDYLPLSVSDLIYLGVKAPVLLVAILGSTWAIAWSKNWWHNGIRQSGPLRHYSLLSLLRPYALRRRISWLATRLIMISVSARL